MRAKGRSFAVGLGIGWALVMLVTYSRVGTPVDAQCYYGFDPADPWNTDRCFLYSPPIEMLMMGIRSIMPFEVFTFVLRAAELAVLALVAGPALVVALFIPAVAIEINAANINLLLVGAVLIGFRHPWAWALIILTKVTPGVGVLWFAVRREWRNLAVALGATLAFAVVSRAVSPGLWQQYIVGLATEPGGQWIWLKVPLAVVVVVWGARNDHRWALMLAVFLALPRWYYLSPVLLVGLFPLVRLPRPLPGEAWLRSVRPSFGHLRRVAVQPAATASDGRTVRAPSS
jgi:hypothetical protein